MPTEHDYINVRDLFVSINPNGLDQSELTRDGASFLEPQTINDYNLFRAGYQAALEAQQGQGEPVGYQIRSKTDRPGSQWKPWRECCDTERALHGHEVGRFNQFGIMREIRPVFANAADPAEVERLREQVSAYKESRERLHEWLREEQLKNIRLHAQLAERDGHLENALDVLKNVDDLDRTGEGVKSDIERMLSASAEPSAPVEIDEPVCRGAWQLGTACGKCRRCKENPATWP